MCREYTKEEMREKFLKNIESIVRYWSDVNLNPKRDNIKYRCEGVGFSIMGLLDGCNCGMPSMLLIPYPHPDDKQFHIENNENYYPEPTQEMLEADIGGGLHEELFK